MAIRAACIWIYKIDNAHEGQFETADVTPEGMKRGGHGPYSSPAVKVTSVSRYGGS